MIIEIIKRLVLPACAVAVLAACGQSAPVRYYSLQSMEADYQRDPEDAAVLGLGPLRVPEYLARQQIITYGDNSRLLVDEFSRWAEPMDDAIHRIVALNVDSLMDDVVVVPFPYGQLARFDYLLVGNIDSFHADTEGEAVLLVQWSVVGEDSEPVISPRRSRYVVDARAGDPGSVAAALSDLAAQFSRDIATNLGAALQTGGE